MTEVKDYYSEFDDDKNTRLHYVAARNVPDEITEVLDSGHKVDPENYLGWTPLMMAARNGHFDMVKTLIEHKADATKKNLYGSSVFLMSIASGNMDVVHFILQHLLHGGVSRQSMECLLSPFVCAILFEHEHIIHYLISNSFNVNNVLPVTGITPIMFAALKENENLFQLLISKGADPFVKNINNQCGQDIMTANQQNAYNRQSQHTHCQSRQQHYRHNHRGHSHLLPTQFHKPFPVVYVSPQPTFIDVSANNPNQMRKSSNVDSPYFVMSPGISPITPQFAFAPQVFFPQEYNPNLLLSPADPYFYSTETSLLNQNIYHSPLSFYPNYNYQSNYNMENHSPV